MSTIITSPLLSSKVISNLDTYFYTVQSAAVHVATLAINAKPPSGITIGIQKNGVTVASDSIPAGQQQSINLSASMNCAVNDLITFIVASSTPSDQGPQAFKGILNIHIGSSN